MSFLSVLGETRCEVRVMVLYADQLHSLPIECVSRRQVVGVEIMRDDLRLDGEQPLEVPDPLVERSQRLVVLEVTDVVVPDSRRGSP